MGLIRKSWRFATFGLTGVPLAHKRSKKDHIVRNTNRTARAMERIARQQAAPSSRQGPPPGWYLDPNGTGQQRWWDGTAWTEHTVTYLG